MNYWLRLVGSVVLIIMGVYSSVKDERLLPLGLSAIGTWQLLEVLNILP